MVPTKNKQIIRTTQTSNKVSTSQPTSC